MTPGVNSAHERVPQNKEERGERLLMVSVQHYWLSFSPTFFWPLFLGPLEPLAYRAAKNLTDDFAKEEV